MEIIEFIQKNWNSFTVGFVLAIILYLGHKEVWVFGVASRREIAAERKIAGILQEQIDHLEEQLASCQKDLERSQMSVLRGNLIAEKTVQIAEQLQVKVIEEPKGK